MAMKITLRRARRRNKTSCHEQPQHYEHRTECGIEALGHAVNGCQMLARFLSDQQSPDWRDIYRLLDAATHDLNNAVRWTRKASAYRKSKNHRQPRRHAHS
jgi:hypothetical protein